MNNMQESLWISDKTEHEFIDYHHVLELERFGFIQCGIAHCRELFTIQRTNMHKHMLLYTVKGKGWLKSATQQFALEPGSLAVVPAGIINTFGIEQEDWQIAWVFLDPSKNWQGLVNASIDYHLTSVTEAVYAAVLLLLRARMTPIKISGEIVKVTTAQLSLLVKASLDHSLSSKQLRLKRVFDDAQRQLHREWDVEQLAALFPCSSPHFHRLCKQYFGHSPVAYLTKMRMEYASRLLLSTDWAVAHIGELVGYTVLANFSARFKVWSGQTPRQYRKNRGEWVGEL